MEQGDRAAVHRQIAAVPRSSGAEAGGGRAGASGGINAQSHTGFCSEPETFTGGRRAQFIFLNFWD